MAINLDELRARPLDPEVDDEIDTLRGRRSSEYLAGELDEDVFRVIRLNQGIYGQRQGGTNQMVRVKVPLRAGRARAARDARARSPRPTRAAGATSPPARTCSSTSSQLERHARGAAPARVGRAHQPRGVRRHRAQRRRLPPRRRVPATRCSTSRPWAEAATDLFLRNPIAQRLPRKFKINFSGCATDCGQAMFNDVGVIAVTRPARRRHRSSPASGCSSPAASARTRTRRRRSRSSPAARTCSPTIEAILRTFDHYGNRDNKLRARMKWLVDTMGIDELRERIIKERKFLRGVGHLPRSASPTIVAERRRRAGRHRHRRSRPTAASPVEFRGLDAVPPLGPRQRRARPRQRHGQRVRVLPARRHHHRAVPRPRRRSSATSTSRSASPTARTSCCAASPRTSSRRCTSGSPSSTCTSRAPSSPATSWAARAPTPATSRSPSPAVSPPTSTARSTTPASPRSAACASTSPAARTRAASTTSPTSASSASSGAAHGRAAPGLPDAARRPASATWRSSSARRPRSCRPRPRRRRSCGSSGKFAGERSAGETFAEWLDPLRRRRRRRHDAARTSTCSPPRREPRLLRRLRRDRAVRGRGRRQRVRDMSTPPACATWRTGVPTCSAAPVAGRATRPSSPDGRRRAELCPSSPSSTLSRRDRTRVGGDRVGVPSASATGSCSRRRSRTACSSTSRCRSRPTSRSCSSTRSTTSPRRSGTSSRSAARYDLNLTVMRPKATLDDLWHSDPDACCRVRKVEPLERGARGQGRVDERAAARREPEPGERRRSCRTTSAAAS